MQPDGLFRPSDAENAGLLCVRTRVVGVQKHQCRCVLEFEALYGVLEQDDPLFQPLLRGLSPGGMSEMRR